MKLLKLFSLFYVLSLHVLDCINLHLFTFQSGYLSFVNAFIWVIPVKLSLRQSIGSIIEPKSLRAEERKGHRDFDLYAELSFSLIYSKCSKCQLLKVTVWLLILHLLSSRISCPSLRQPLYSHFFKNHIRSLIASQTKWMQLLQLLLLLLFSFEVVSVSYIPNLVQETVLMFPFILCTKLTASQIIGFDYHGPSHAVDSCGFSQQLISMPLPFSG